MAKIALFGMLVLLVWPAPLLAQSRQHLKTLLYARRLKQQAYKSVRVVKGLSQKDILKLQGMRAGGGQKSPASEGDLPAYKKSPASEGDLPAYKKSPEPLRMSLVLEVPHSLFSKSTLARFFTPENRPKTVRARLSFEVSAIRGSATGILNVELALPGSMTLPRMKLGSRSEGTLRSISQSLGELSAPRADHRDSGAGLRKRYREIDRQVERDQRRQLNDQLKQLVLDQISGL